MTPTSTVPSIIRIYSLTSFDRGAKARWLLTEMGLPYESKMLDRESREHEGPEFLRLNPMGRVPVLQFGDTVIFESGAICAFLADLYLEKGLAPALSSPDRARYQQWMYFAAATLDVIQTRIMIIEDIPEGQVRTQKESALLAEVRDAMNTLDLALSRADYLVGNRMSAADICVSYHTYWFSLWPELDVIMREFPRVVSYIERMRKTPSAVKADVFSYEG